MTNLHEGRLRQGAKVALGLALVAMCSCARAGGATTATSANTDQGDKTSQTVKTTTTAAAEPMIQQRVAPALDPEKGGGPCAGYAFDGVALDMPRTAIETSVPLVHLKPADSLLEGFPERTYGFHAARPGRVDDVQVGFSSGDNPIVERLQAHVLVAENDAWPRTLFDGLGSPKNARIGEWIWWDMSCRATLRLSRIEAIGAETTASYVLDVRHTLKPLE